MAAFALTIFATAYLCALLLLVAASRPSYSHVRDTISELGEFGVPQQRFVAFGIFLPVGAVLLLVAYLLRPLGQASATLALCIAIGYLAAAAFPCDPGSPNWGSWRQALHNLGGAIEYVGGAISFWRLSETFGQPFKVAGFIVAGATIVLSLKGAIRIRGIIQRVAELCLFGGLALAIWLSRRAV